MISNSVNVVFTTTNLNYNVNGVDWEEEHAFACLQLFIASQHFARVKPIDYIGPYKDIVK